MMDDSTIRPSFAQFSFQFVDFFSETFVGPHRGHHLASRNLVKTVLFSFELGSTRSEFITFVQAATRTRTDCSPVSSRA